jgi:hypothetical protein
LAKQKSLNELSAAELFDLAKQREQEEKERERAAAVQEIEQLKARRRELGVQYRKELRAIDAQLQALTGRKKRRTSAGRGRITERILEIISDHGQASTKEIRKELEGSGLETANLSQLLGNLKKNGRISSPSRAVYAMPGRE